MRPPVLAALLLGLLLPFSIQADDVQQLDKAFRQSISEAQGRLRLATQALRPVAEEVAALQAQIDEKHARAEKLNAQADQLRSQIAGASDTINRNVLKQLLGLMLEMAGAMTQTSPADLGVDLFYKAVGKASSANDEPTQDGERPKHFLVALAEMREAAGKFIGQSNTVIKRLRASVEELRGQQAPLKAKLEEGRADCERLAKQLDEAEREHARVLADFVQVRDKMQAEAAEAVKKELDRPLPAAVAAGPGAAFDFGPYLKRLQAMVDAHYDNAWPAGRSLDAEQRALQNEASLRYQAWVKNADDASKKASSAAQARFFEAAKGLRAGLAKDAKARLEEMNALGRELEVIDLTVLREFLKAAESGAPARAKAFLPRSSLLDFKAGGRAFSADELDTEKNALQAGAEDLKACLAFVDSKGPAFSDAFFRSQSRVLDLQDRYTAFKARHHSLLALMSFTYLQGLEPALQTLEAASYHLSDGLLSAGFRLKALEKLAETEDQLLQLQDPSNLGKGKQGGGDKLKGPAETTVSDQQKALLQVAQACLRWKEHQARHDAGGSLELDQADHALLAGQSLAQHGENVKEIRKLSASAKARMPELEAYAAMVPGFNSLEKEVLAKEEAHHKRLKALHAEVMGQPDKSVFLGRYYDKATGRFIGLSAEARAAHERLQALSLPFGSPDIDRLRAESARLDRQLGDVMVKLKAEQLTGPVVTELSVGSVRLSENTLIEAISLDPEDLVGGQVQLSGRCQLPGADLASVQVSLDNGASWAPATRIEGRDRFVHRFSPQPGQAYRLKVRPKDKRGNEGAAFPWGRAPELRYSGLSQDQALATALQDLAAAYSTKSRLAFMRGVAFGFQGYYENLRAAIERDFAAYDTIHLRFDIDKVAFNKDRNEAQVDLRWNRSWVKQPGGGSATDKGESRFKMALEEGRWRLLALGGAPLFGNSLDDSILRPYAGGASGAILPVRYSQGLGNHMSWVMSGGACGDAGFSFVSGAIVTAFPGPLTLDFYLSNSELRSDSGGLYDFGPASLAEVQTAPGSGYSSTQPLSVGHVYIVKVGANFAKLRIRAFDSAVDCNGRPRSLTFDWAYQPNGSPDLR